MMTRDEAAALGSCTLKKKKAVSRQLSVEMVIMVKMSIEKKHGQGDVGGCTITKKSDSVVFLQNTAFSHWSRAGLH